MKHFLKLILIVLVALSVGFGTSGNALAQTSRPLEDVLEDWQGYGWSDIVDIATYEAQNDGPLYPSAPSATPHYETFEGSFSPEDENTKLAIFSDDGCDVYINETKVHSGKDNGQALPNLSQSLHRISTSFQAGQTYQIRVEYSNTEYKGAADIDGASLFAYTDGANLPINISTNKTEICAGAVNSTPHQANIRVVAMNSDGSFAAGKTVSFSVDTFLPGSSSALSSSSPDADLRATISPLTATTNAQGIARATLTSSQQIGATAVVKASSEGNQDQTEAITMEDAEGEMSIDADEMVADGQSTTNVYLDLYHGGEPIQGHRVTFHIDSVVDANNNPVQPAADGTFPGYGSITTTQGTTDEYGVAYGTFTSGTIPGTITFRSDDHSVVLNDQVAVAKNLNRPRMFAVSYSPASYSSRTRLAQAGRARQPSPRRENGTGRQNVATVTLNVIKVTYAIVSGPTRSIHPPTSSLTTETLSSYISTVWSPANIRYVRMKNFEISVVNYRVDYNGGVDTNYMGWLNNYVNNRIDRSFRAGINAFAMKKIGSRLANYPSVRGMASGSHTFWVQDASSSTQEVVSAHEAGHCMGLADFYLNNRLYADNLMCNFDGTSLTLIQKNRAYRYVTDRQSAFWPTRVSAP